MGAHYHRTLDVLTRHVAALNARSVLSRAARNNGFHAEDLQPHQLRTILPDLERSLGLFCEPSRREQLVAELAALAGAPEKVQPVKVTLAAEQDISVARNAARSLCEALGARPIVVQKISTIVSELARNIISYTEGGDLELVPVQELRRVTIRARDEGPGIPNLNEILGGGYRSRTGMGMGLLGTKRLADRFDVRTGPSGTQVEAEVSL
jgi:serine/threonine-protein kinase RsbT